jgi:2-keto-3-deoxy-L-rhamnonate aldolase RhmA
MRKPPSCSAASIASTGRLYNVLQPSRLPPDESRGLNHSSPCPTPYGPASSKPARILKEKMMKGHTVFGTLIQHAVVPAIVDFIPDGSIDFVIVTAEHNALDIADFMPLRYALAAKGIATLARTHSRDADDVAKVCDSFDGVVIPYAEDVELIKRLAAAAVYRPLKGEALERVIKEGKWPSDKTRDYIEQKCADTLFVPNDRIRPRRGKSRRHLLHPRRERSFHRPERHDDEHGHPERIRSPRLHRQRAEGHRRRRQAPHPRGLWFGKTEQQLRAIKQGARFICHSNDSSLLKASFPGRDSDCPVQRCSSQHARHSRNSSCAVGARSAVGERQGSGVGFIRRVRPRRWTR